MWAKRERDRLLPSGPVFPTARGLPRAPDGAAICSPSGARPYRVRHFSFRAGGSAGDGRGQQGTAGDGWRRWRTAGGY